MTKYATTMMAEGIIEVLIVAFTRQILHGNASTLGWIMTAQGVGALLASIVSQQVIQLFQPRYLLMFSFGIIGLLFIVIFNVPIFAVALIVMAIAGALIVWAMITAQTLMQKAVADSYRGRVFDSYSTVLSLMVLIGMGIASAFTGLLGTTILLDISGIIFTISGLLFIKMPVATLACAEAPAQS